MAAFLRFVTREPVMLGAAFLAWVQVTKPSDVVNVAMTASVAWLVRMASAPKDTVADAHAAGYDKAVAEVSALALSKNP